MLSGPWSTVTYILSAGCQWAALPSGMSRLMQGLMMQAIVHTADFQHHDGGMLLLDTLFGLFPFLPKLHAHGDYQRPMFQTGRARSATKSTSSR
jgi:hypothetical protein